jgi:3-isopropylmalate dehydrogenase
VHGSAPDIAGRSLANPIAMIGSFGMALRYSFGLTEAADRLEQAIANVLASGARTSDIAGSGANALGTAEMGDAIVRALAART